MVRPPHLPLRARGRERGFTLVEIIVAMLITAIILGIGIYAISTARGSGRSIGAVSVARAYSDAADKFAREHRGRFPAAPGSTDWPGGAAARRGPVADLLGDRRFYLKTVPESVQDGSVTFQDAGPARVSYRQIAGGYGFELLVEVTDRPSCAVRGGDTTGASAAPDC